MLADWDAFGYPKGLCENCKKPLTPDNTHMTGMMAWCLDCAEHLGLRPYTPMLIYGSAPCPECGTKEWCNHKRDAYLGFVVWRVQRGDFVDDGLLPMRTADDIALFR